MTLPIEKTTLPKNSHLVRFLISDEEGAPYDRMMVVTELNRGKSLFLQGWIEKEDKSITHNEWKALKEKHFPKAEEVRFIRWCPRRKSYRNVVIKLPSKI